MAGSFCFFCLFLFSALGYVQFVFYAGLEKEKEEKMNKEVFTSEEVFMAIREDEKERGLKAFCVSLIVLSLSLLFYLILA